MTEDIKLTVYKCLLFITVLFVIFQIFSGVSYGSFEIDYYEAHLKTINLFKEYETIDAIQKMSLSASGIFPLWLQSNLDTLFERRILNTLVWLITIYLIYETAIKSEIDKRMALILVYSYCISPMTQSNTAWGLSEIYVIFLIYLFLYLIINSRLTYLCGILFAAIILCRQNLLGLLYFAAILLKKRIIVVTSIIFSTFAIIFLIYNWGGLVPRGLERHLTPSFRIFIYSLAIFSLYYFLNFKFKLRKIIIYVPIISLICYFVIKMTPELLGGGYIFSRIMQRSEILGVIVLGFCLYNILFINKFLVILLLISSITLSTTNYIFLKYIDTLVYFIFAIQLIFINEQRNNILLEKISKKIKFNKELNLNNQIYSMAIFQTISLILATIFYA